MGCICAKGAKYEKKSGNAKRTKKVSERLSSLSSRKGGVEVQADGGGNFSREGEEGIELQAVNGRTSSWKEGIQVQAVNRRTSSRKEGIQVQTDNEGNSSLKEGTEVQSESGLSSSQEGTVVEVDNGSDEDTILLIGTDDEESENFSATASEERDDELLVFGHPAALQLPRGERMASGLQGEEVPICKALNVRNGADGAQVAAGWPSWLSAVAGEAINGWLPRKLDSFEKLDKIGQGTYSDVYRARDLETGKMVALKKLHFKNTSQESACFMSREILILRMLDHPNVMKLEGLITSRFSNSLHLIFEYMEHDLAGMAASHELTEPQIKCYMQQLFNGLEHCHNRGVLHRDIKCSNLLIDDNGNLKIGDFGLATYVCPDERRPLTTCVVTLWYRPPELLLGDSNYGQPVDLWSSGCILAELYEGKPIMPGRTEVEQMHKIFKLCGSPSEQYWKKFQGPHAAIFKPPHPYNRRVAEVFKDLTPSALALLESLLALDPEHRGSATCALQSEFFLTEPLPCDPSSLPKFPPSKEINARMRMEAAQRWRPVDGRGIGLESSRNDTYELSEVPAPNSNAEFKASKKKWKVKSLGNIAKYDAEEDGDSCFTLELSKWYSQTSHPLQKDGSGNVKEVGDEGPHLNSSTPLYPSEYIELKFDSSNKSPQMTTVSGSRKHSGNGNDKDNSKLDYGGETGVGMLMQQEQSSNTGNEHTDDAKLSESNYIHEKPGQSLNNGNENTDDAKLFESNHEPEQSLNSGNEHTDDAKLSESNQVLGKPDYSSHKDDNKEMTQPHQDETATVDVDAPNKTPVHQIAQKTDSNTTRTSNIDQDRENADAAVITNVETGK